MDLSTAHTAFRVTGHGPIRVLLLHALTGGPDAADREGVKGWWAPIFREGAPFEASACTVWTPNLLGSCYGSTGPQAFSPFPEITIRDQAQVLADWIRREGLSFDLLLGVSLGGMVALELALLAPECFRRLGVVGAGGRADAWLWATNEIQRAILEDPALPDDRAIALARHAAMLTFRAPDSINGRFHDRDEIRGWLRHHGRALADRYHRETFRLFLGAMDSHDLGRDRDGLVAALRGLQAPLWLLGIDSDLLFVPSSIQELADAAQAAGRLAELRWLHSPHGHDAFLMTFEPVSLWLRDLLASC